MADENELIRQEEIERLLQAARGSNKPEEPGLAASSPASGAVDSDTEAHAQVPPSQGEITAGDIELLLSRATEALQSIDAPSAGPAGASLYQLQELAGTPASTEMATLDLVNDVELDLRIELGRTHMYLEDVLRLCKGSVVPLDKLAGDPVDIFVNGRLIARGEVLVLNDNFCVRVAELVAGAGAE